jgi:hypothetical protein
MHVGEAALATEVDRPKSETGDRREPIEKSAIRGATVKRRRVRRHPDGIVFVERHEGCPIAGTDPLGITRRQLPERGAILGRKSWGRAPLRTAGDAEGKKAY